MSRAVRRAREEDGAVLIAVIGLMAVGLLVVSLVSASAISALGSTSSIRAGVQSQAAAEAGVDAARAIVDKNTCTASLLDHSAATYPLRYRVQIAWRSSSTAAWTNRCPVYQKGQVRYTATGYAQARGSAGVSANDVAHVETIFGTPAVTTINPTGAAIYSYGVAGGTGISGLIGSISGVNPSVQVYQGNAACNGAITVGSLPLTSISASVLVRSGNFDMSACTVNGNVSASGSVTVTGSDLLHTATVNGSVTANSLTMTGYSTVTGGATVRSTPVKNSVAAISLLGIPLLGTKSPTLSGTVTVGTPATPVVPGWTEFDYQGASQWPGFVIKTLTAAQCNSYGISLVLSGLLSTQSVLLDAQACTAGLAGINISLTNNIALIVPNTVPVSLSGLNLALPIGSTATKMWIIQPDADVTDNKPTCPAGASLTTGAINLGLVQTMVYTPCTYNETGLIGATRGQIYAGMASLSTAISLGRTYSQNGLPGVDLTAGTSTATGPRALVTTRNVTTGP